MTIRTRYPDMKVYVIKIAVRGASPMVWRRLRIAADTSLAALHFIFQIAQGWGNDYLHQFHIYGKDYGISYEGGIGFMDNPFRIVIDDFGFGAGDRFTYEYNFFEHWLHDVRIETIYEMTKNVILKLLPVNLFQWEPRQTRAALVLSRRATAIRNADSWHTFRPRECRPTSRYSFYPTARIT